MGRETTHTTGTTRVCVLVEERYRTQLQPAGLVAAEERGIPTLDPSASIAAVRDKAGMSRIFAEAGLPVPRTWAGTGRQVHGDILADPWPDRADRLIAKPVFGDNGEGIVVLDTVDDVASLQGDWVVQELVPSRGADLKLYAIGEQVWAARKASPVTPCRTADLGPVAVSRQWRDLALECGRLFDLSIFGVDCLEVDGELVVIEVNDFPNFTSVPGAGDRLARHVLQGAC